jgi:hypothetical protein
VKLALIVSGACVVCRVPARQHERCAVCEVSNQVVRLCAFCREWNERHGVEWNDKKLDAVVDGGDDGVDSSPTGTLLVRPLRDVMAPTRRRGRPRSAKLDDAIIPRLRRAARKVLVTVERIDLEGRNRGSYQRWEWVSRREIARRVGCSHASVDRRFHDYTRAKSRNPRANAARPVTKLVK